MFTLDLFNHQHFVTYTFSFSCTYIHTYTYIIILIILNYLQVGEIHHGTSLLNQFSSVAQSCPTLCDPIDRTGFPVLHQLPELTQTPINWVRDAIQPSHSQLSPSLPAFNLSQHQGLFKWVSSSHQVAKLLEFQLQHQSFQWIFRTDFL